MSVTISFDDARIFALYQQAEIAAVDETTAACVPLGQALVHVDTARLRSAIGVIPARATATGVEGAYGVPHDPGYAAPQEFFPEPRGKAYIRPAADREFPNLAGRIAKRVK